jgi:rubrerythrin
MLKKRVKEKKKCRKCGKVPKAGYFISRAIRNDWVCPDCCSIISKEIRDEKRKTIEEGDND